MEVQDGELDNGGPWAKKAESFFAGFCETVALRRRAEFGLTLAAPGPHLSVCSRWHL
jgi:hypothetical protein